MILISVNNPSEKNFSPEEIGALHDAGVRPRNIPEGALWKINTRVIGGDGGGSAVTYVTENDLVAVMDGGVIDSKFSPPNRDLSDDAYAELCEAFASTGIDLPGVDGFEPANLAEVATRAIEESDARSIDSRSFLENYRFVSHSGEFHFNYRKSPVDAAEQAERFAIWATDRLESALEIGDWGRVIEAREVVLTRGSPATRRGPSGRTSHREHGKAFFLSRVPMREIAEWALSEDELDQFNSFFRKEPRSWHGSGTTLPAEAMEFFPGIAQKIIDFLGRAMDEIIEAAIS